MEHWRRPAMPIRAVSPRPVHASVTLPDKTAEPARSTQAIVARLQVSKGAHGIAGHPTRTSAASAVAAAMPGIDVSAELSVTVTGFVSPVSPGAALSKTGSLELLPSSLGRVSNGASVMAPPSG